MKASPPTRRLPVAMLLLVATIAAALASRAAIAEPAPPATEPAVAAGRGSIEEGIVATFGDGDQKVHVVVRGGLWSMHAETMPVQSILALWHEAGGPEVVLKNPVDHAFTLSVHRVTTERLVERLLGGYGYTLHYGIDGKLATVRVYSPEPGYPFHNPRLVESFGTWRQVEMAQAMPAGAQPEPSVAPAAADSPPPR